MNIKGIPECRTLEQDRRTRKKAENVEGRKKSEASKKVARTKMTVNHKEWTQDCQKKKTEYITSKNQTLVKKTENRTSHK